MRQRTGKKRPRERTRGRRRDGDDDSASSASEGEDWRQEVWRRGYQGAMPWAAAWQMWPQGVAAMQYAGQQMHGEAGNFRAHQRQSEPPWTQQSQGRRGDNGWGSRKRQRRTFPEQRGRWEEEEEEEGEEQSYPERRRTFPSQRDRWEEEEEAEQSFRSRRKRWDVVGEEAYAEDAEDQDQEGVASSGHLDIVPEQRRRQHQKPKKPQQPPPMNEFEDAEDDMLIQPLLEMKTEVVEVPKKFIAKIIGKKGAQIKTIRDETGAHVDARDQTQDPCQVKLLGSPDACEAARQKILEIIEQAKHKKGLVLEIPRAKIGKVIGIRGAQVHEIQTTTGAKVDVDKDCDPCKVVIGGDDAQVAAAQNIILTLAMEAADQESEYLELPSQVSGAVLGVRGARLMELQAASGARIDVDKTMPSACCRVRIAGTPEQRETARHLVMLAAETPRSTEEAALVAAAEGEEPSMDSEGVLTMPLPSGVASKLLRQHGTLLHSVQSDSGARMWVDGSTSRAQISGQPEAIERAKLSVQALIDEALAEVGVGDAAGAGGNGEIWDWPGSVEAANASVGGSGEWGPEQGAAAQADQWAASGHVEEAPAEPWEWTGQAPVAEEELSLQSAGEPQTAMQAAFARMAARLRGQS